MINFFSFRKDIEEKNILANGRRVYNQNLIVNLVCNYEDAPTFTCTATVISESSPSDSYEIELTIEDDYVEDWRCKCPYYRRNGRLICKHIIGVLFELEANHMYPNPKTKEKTKNLIKAEDEEEQQNLIDTTLCLDKVHKEIECQICLEILTKPILMPCYMHSICHDCCKKLFLLNKNVKRIKEISCPTCSEEAGVFEVDNFTDLKGNKELERVIEAYKIERNSWFNEKNKLLQEINDLKVLKNETKEAITKENQGGLETKNKEELQEIIKKCQELKKQKTQEEKNTKKKRKMKVETNNTITKEMDTNFNRMKTRKMPNIFDILTK